MRNPGGGPSPLGSQDSPILYCGVNVGQAPNCLQEPFSNLHMEENESAHLVRIKGANTQGPTFWRLWATLEEEELSWATTH